MIRQVERLEAPNPNAMPASPDALYLGLQKTGSAFLRGYFSAHPDVVWTRAAEAWMRADGVEGYLEDARTAYAGELAKLSMGPAPRIWIDMFESLGLGYRFLPGHRWQAETMLAAAPTGGDAFIDPSPPMFFESLKTACPHARVLLTVRKQTDWLFSNYHHYGHHFPAERRSFTDFLDSMEGRILAESANFDRLVEKLHAVFGPERVLVVPLEALHRDAEAELRHISAFLGCRYVPFRPSEKDWNRGVEFRRGGGRSEIPMLAAQKQRTGALRRLFDYAQFMLGLSGPDKAFTIPSKAVLQREFGGAIDSRYAASNRRLSRLIGADLAALGYPL